jgi:predicted ATPase
LARRGENDEFHLQAHHSAWTTGFFCGELIEAHAHVAEGRRLYDAQRHQSHRFIYGGHDPGVCASYTAAQTGWLLGHPDKAAESAAEALAMADRLAHPLTREVGLEYAAHVHLHRREPEISLAYLLTLDQLRVEQRVSFVIEPDFMRAAVLVAQGAYDDAAAMLRGTFAPGRVITTAWQPYGRAVLAEALLRQGANAEALACLSHAFDRVQATGERVWEAELHRIRALALLAQNQIEEGQETLRHAIRVASEQQAKSLELRAATSLAQFWGEQGRRTEAQQLLTPVYGRFTEGFDTMDLKEAKALLDALA